MNNDQALEIVNTAYDAVNGGSLAVTLPSVEDFLEAHQIEDDEQAMLAQECDE